MTRASQALDAEHGRYLDLFEHAPDGYLVTDAAGIIQEVNRAAETLLKESRKRLCGKSLVDFISEAQRRAFRIQLHRICQGFEERMPGRAFRLHLLSGAGLDVSLSVAATRAPEKRLTLLRWLMRDISEHKRFERYLAAQYAVASVFSKAKDLSEACVRLLQSMCRCFGAELGELWEVDAGEGRLRWSGAWHAPGLRAVSFTRNGRETSLAPGECCAGRVWALQRPLWHGDLEDVCAPRRASMARSLGFRAVGGLPIRDRKGVIGIIVLFMRDIVDPGDEMSQILDALGRQIGDMLERRRMEAEIFHLAAIVESSEDAIVGKSLDRIITSWNAGAERLYQYSAAEARGRPITILLPPERYDESVQIVERIVRGERIDHFETVHVRKDGRPVDVSLTISPIRDAAGKIAGASLISRDITERKRAEEAVRTAHAALERNREELRALAARLLTAQEEERRRVSRELHDDTSQKLALLIVEIETLERNLPGPASEILEQLRSFRERAADLSDDVHNLAYRLHPSILEDLGLAVALRSHVKDFASREGIKVRLTIRSLPPALPRELASCLYRVTQEGMRNAAKHSHTRRMAIMLTGSARGIHLSIKDWGLGFEPETLKARRGGLGIISMEERVRLMNGTFCLRSKIGRGTQVAVFLPLPEDLG